MLSPFKAPSLENTCRYFKLLKDSPFSSFREFLDKYKLTSIMA